MLKLTILYNDFYNLLQLRYVCTFIVMFTVLKYKNLNILGPKKQFKLLLFRGLIGSFALITVYFAVLFLKPSDQVAISQTSLVITALLARIFLKERLCLGHFVAITLAVIGVLLISKPSFLFDSSSSPARLAQQKHQLVILNCSLVNNLTDNLTTTSSTVSVILLII